MGIGELKKLEETFEIELPKSYKLFLLEHNGGKPSPCDFKIGEGNMSSLHHFYGINDGPKYQRLGYNIEVQRDRKPESINPFADEPC